MKILLLSNQGMKEDFVGNPIMLRFRDALLADTRIKDVKMLRCNNPLAVANKLRKYAKDVDVIHIHFGGLYALAVWFILIGINRKKIITFHGTDIHAKAIRTSESILEKVKIRLNQWASFISIVLYDKCGFVANEMTNYIPSLLKKILSKKVFVQPLGVDYNLFSPIQKAEAQELLALKPAHYVLFSDVSNSTIKRRDIAQKIISRLPNYEILIMCGVPPKKVPLYINACDFLLLTSEEEGSPNIIREALALNKPVFSVDVGDAFMQLKGLSNSQIISKEPTKAANQIINALSLQYTDNTRISKKALIDFAICNKCIIDMYSELK